MDRGIDACQPQNPPKGFIKTSQMFNEIIVFGDNAAKTDPMAKHLEIYTITSTYCFINKDLLVQKYLFSVNDMPR
jgi:hypothetical protein